MHSVLVTGASGFVGSHIVQALRARGIAVRCLVRRTSRLDVLRPSAPEFAWGDVGEPETLGPALAGVDAVIHCAGLTRARSRSEYFQVNADGSRNLYCACTAHKGRLARIIHISSLAALGPATAEKPVTEDNSPRPVNDYGESKLAGQRMAEACMDQLPISVLIPPAVYGPRDIDFLAYFKWVARGFVPLVGRRPCTFSLIYIADLVEAILRVLFSERAAGRSYLVSDGCYYGWTDLADTVGAALNRRPQYVYLPASAARIVGMIGDLTARVTGKARLISSQKIRELLQVSWTCSSQRISEELDYRAAYLLEAGVRETLAWYRENSWL
jgi:nucleoside-diphosphate-sugar epimerase